MKRELNIALKAAYAAGELLIEFQGRIDKVRQREEHYRELVSVVDVVAEEKIREIIAQDSPHSSVWGEEMGGRRGDDELLWIIDPVDGTVNYLHGIPLCAVSIGLAREGTLICGVVYNPFTREMFYAAEGVGAYLNEKPLQVAKVTETSEGLFSWAFSATRDEYRQREYLLYGEINDRTRGCLRTGSAAINLAYVASGRMTGFFGRNVKIWDVAAGLALVRLAGGAIRLTKSTEWGAEYYSCVATCSKHLDLNILEQVFPHEFADRNDLISAVLESTS